MARAGKEPLSLGDLAGLSERHPALAAALTVFLDLAHRQFPSPPASSASSTCSGPRWARDTRRLAVVGVLMSVVSAYYYLRVVVAMYMHEPPREVSWPAPSPAASLALAVSVALVLALGIYPAPVLELAHRAAQSLL